MILGRYRRHKAFYVGLIAGFMVLAVTLFFLPAQAIVWSANAFFIGYLVVSLMFFPRASAAFLKSHADQEDAPVWIIFVVTAAVIVAAVISLFQLLNADGQADAFRLIVTAVSVPLGWFTIHAMVAHHYAFEYYAVPEASSGGKKDKKAVVGGLDFPTGDEPDGGSFLYFSYVIGMTAQVADVSVTSREMQRIVLFHGIFSFFFNTVILAATVNVAVTLGGMK
ncbi:putative membrane protein [Devosia sp. UYZn731]|uniref:DUF1345 domain-containing protein n=1 Tax=Devosia sp. UYZn731 TaxID=3156345 RepID=UPI003399B51C